MRSVSLCRQYVNLQKSFCDVHDNSAVFRDLDIVKWSQQWRVTKTVHDCQQAYLSSPEYVIAYGTSPCSESSTSLILGGVVKWFLTWDKHKETFIRCASIPLNLRTRLGGFFSPKIKLLLYKSYVRPVLESARPKCSSVSLYG